LEELRREFGRLPVRVGVEDSVVYVRLASRVEDRQFRRCVETCKRLGFNNNGKWVPGAGDIRQRVFA